MLDAVYALVATLRHPVSVYRTFRATTRNPEVFQDLLVRMKVCEDCSNGEGMCDYHLAKTQYTFRERTGAIPAMFRE